MAVHIAHLEVDLLSKFRCIGRADHTLSEGSVAFETIRLHAVRLTMEHRELLVSHTRLVGKSWRRIA